ncbi:MAG: carboxypeptidase regulatory-like domain-containing protein, partial [Candidatus Hatepunaea meridiana]|nr:carboxypeptidase regulatory-like domain-containing protein [Candidatus Hatepunaea meridiana]
MKKSHSFYTAILLLLVFIVAPSYSQFREIERIDLGDFDVPDTYGIATNHEDGLIYVMRLRENTVVVITDDFEEVVERIHLEGPADCYGFDYIPEDNSWWLGDASGRHIYHFDVEGELLDDFGANCQVHGITYCPENDHLYIADWGQTIREITLDNELIESYQINYGATSIEYYPPNGTLLVMSGNDLVDEYSLDGELIEHVMGQDAIPGNGLGMDYNPWTRTLYTTWQMAGIVVWEDNYSALPEPEFDPEAFELVVNLGLEIEETLTIRNVGEEESVLRFSLDDTGEGVDWIEIDPVSGMIEHEEEAEITLTINTEDLEPGDFERTIIVCTNNPEFFEVEIPATLSVIAGYGELRGTVTDPATDDPIADALVLIERFDFREVTNEDGEYHFEEIPAWIYDVVVTAEDYHSLVAEEVEVLEDEVTELDFELLHAEFTPSRDEFHLVLEPD